MILTGEAIVVLSINTIWYPAGHTPEIDPSSNPDPAGQFAWIEENLKAARSAGQTYNRASAGTNEAERSLFTEYTSLVMSLRAPRIGKMRS